MLPRVSGDVIGEAWARAFDGSDGSGLGLQHEQHGDWEAELATVEHAVHEARYDSDYDSGGLDGSAGAGGSVTRKDCGFPGIGEVECVEERGCRWDDTQLDVPWCYL